MCELDKQVLALIGSRTKLTHLPLPGDYPCQRQPDISTARNLLRWNPTVRLTDGLRTTIDYLDSLLSRDGIGDTETRR
jgi:UDP-glucuronate decarboxylase